MPGERSCRPGSPKRYPGSGFGPVRLGKKPCHLRGNEGDTRTRYSISATTRQKRSNERDGIDYHFVSMSRFQDMIRQDDLLEYAEVYGNFYGTPRKPIEDILAAGEDVILDLDVQGALQIRQRCLDAVLVFLLPPSIAELERRIRSRGTDDEETIQRRMNSALREISALSQYTYMIVNDELEDAVRSLVAIIEAERCRTSRFVSTSSDEVRSQSDCR